MLRSFVCYNIEWFATVINNATVTVSLQMTCGAYLGTRSTKSSTLALFFNKKRVDKDEMGCMYVKIPVLGVESGLPIEHVIITRLT